jgi:RimJ/RimL family protein N-acetyltransferase
MIQEPIAVLPVIAAERVVLRPLRRSDAGLVTLYAADERVARGTRTIPHPLPPGTTEGFIARAMSDRRDADTWAIDGSARGLDEVLGLVTLAPVEDGQSEIGYWVAPAFWNTGFASEAVSALVAANPHRSSSLVAEVFQDNPASARVLTNAGFAYLGDAESWSVARGAKVPTWTYLRRMG